MAKGKKTGGRDFKPGVVTNPKGRTPLPPEVRQARRNLGDFIKSGMGASFQRFLSMSGEELEAWAKEQERHQTATVMELYVAQILSKAMESGDMSILDKLMDRFLGRPKQAVDLSGQINEGTQLTPAQLKAMAREFMGKG